MSSLSLADRIEGAPSPLSLAECLAESPSYIPSSPVTGEESLVPIDTRPPSRAHLEPSCYVFTLTVLYHKQHYYRTASFLYHDPTSPHFLCLQSEGVAIYDTRTCFTVLFHR